MKPCDYGICNVSRCTDPNCTEQLPQYPKHVAALPSLLLPQERKELRRWCHEDAIFIQFTNGSIRVVSSDSRSSNQTV